MCTHTHAHYHVRCTHVRVRASVNVHIHVRHTSVGAPELIHVCMFTRFKGHVHTFARVNVDSHHDRCEYIDKVVLTNIEYYYLPY